MQEKPILNGGSQKQARTVSLDKDAARRTLDCGLVGEARDGNLEGIKSLVKMGANVEAKDYWGKTALMCACMNGHEDVALFLIDSGAGMNAGDKDGWTPIMFAAHNGFSRLVETLIDKGADVYAIDNMGYSVLMHALSQESIDTARMMSRKGFGLKNQKMKWYPVPDAASDGKDLAVKFLVEEGADIDAMGGLHCITALDCGIRCGNFGLAKFLLDNGANIDKGDTFGKTPLMRAAANCSIEKMSFLLENGANPDAMDQNNGTALKLASEYGHIEAVRLLVENKASLDLGGMTALLHALRNRHAEVAKFLVKSGADVNMADKEGKTALMWAAPWADVDVAKIILEKVAHGMVNASDKERKTALIHAAEGRNIGIIMFLIDNGAWIDTKDIYQNNAVDYALRYDNSMTEMRVPYTDSQGDGMETARFLKFAHIFQPLVGIGPLSELVLDFAECVS